MTQTLTMELHRRGETPAQSALRVLQAANELGLQGVRVVGLASWYKLGEPTMDVVVRHEGRLAVLNVAGDELIEPDPHDHTLHMIADDDGMPRPEAV